MTARAQKLFILVAAFAFASFAPGAVMAQDADGGLPPPVPTADSLNPPPLPKLEKGEWQSKQTTFPDALFLQDADGNDLDNILDLTGTLYTAHLDRPAQAQPQSDSEDDDPIYQLTSGYQKALSDKAYDYRIQIPGTDKYLSGAAGDDEEGGVVGQSVIVNGQVRYIAVGDVKGDAEIFVSDLVPMAEIKEKVATGGKKETPAPKE